MKPPEFFVTADEFADMARISRRTLDRLRRRRLPGFPTEYDLGTSDNKHRRIPRFKRAEVEQWLESRAVW